MENDNFRLLFSKNPYLLVDANLKIIFIFTYLYYKVMVNYWKQGQPWTG